MVQAVLCRYNAPLLLLWYQLVQRGIPCYLVGHAKLANTLQATLKRVLKSNTTHRGSVQWAELKAMLSERQADLDSEEAVQANTGNEDDDDTDADTDADPADSAGRNETDLIDCLLSMVAHVEQSGQPCTCTSLVNEFDKYTKQGNPETGKTSGLVLSTVHKAKGLEYHTVFLLQPGDLLNSTVMQHGARWQAAQEVATAYTAYTRSFSNLVFLRHVNPGKVRTLTTPTHTRSRALSRARARSLSTHTHLSVSFCLSLLSRFFISCAAVSACSFPLCLEFCAHVLFVQHSAFRVFSCHTHGRLVAARVHL